MNFQRMKLHRALSDCMYNTFSTFDWKKYEDWERNKEKTEVSKENF